MVHFSGKKKMCGWRFLVWLEFSFERLNWYGGERPAVSQQYFVTTGKGWGMQVGVLIWLSFVWKILCFCWWGVWLGDWDTVVVCIFWGSPLLLSSLSHLLRVFSCPMVVVVVDVRQRGSKCSCVMFVRVVPLLNQSLLERELEQMYDWKKPSWV